MKPLTSSQQKTLAYIRTNGRIMLGVTGHTGYNTKSAEVLIRLGILVEVWEAHDITHKDGHVESTTNRYAAERSRTTKLWKVAEFDRFGEERRAIVVEAENTKAAIAAATKIGRFDPDHCGATVLRKPRPLGPTKVVRTC